MSLEPPRISLRAARVNACLSQRVAAKALDIDVRTLQNYESGRTVPSWSTVRKMEDLYSYPANFIASSYKENTVNRINKHTAIQLSTNKYK